MVYKATENPVRHIESEMTAMRVISSEEKKEEEIKEALVRAIRNVVEEDPEKLPKDVAKWKVDQVRVFGRTRTLMNKEDLEVIVDDEIDGA